MAFLELTDYGRPLGYIAFELFEDECPNACSNFQMLCTGDRGKGIVTGRPLHYKRTSIFRIVPGLAIQGGDIVNDNGTSGESIFGSIFFNDELSSRPHDRPGLLCSASLGAPNTNSSQFYITSGPCHWQDGRDVVFGRVVCGRTTLAKLDSMGSPNGNVTGDIKIANCGVLSPGQKYEEILYSNPPVSDINPSPSALASGIFKTDYQID